jgi:hypothetical protein
MFKRIMIFWGFVLVILALRLVVTSAPSPAPEAQAAPQRTAQQTIAAPKPWSPEQYRDFTRRVIEACARLPIGDRNRPSESICGTQRYESCRLPVGHPDRPTEYLCGARR